MYKIQFQPGICPRPRWGAYDAPADSLVGWGGGNPFPIPYTPLDAFGVSLSTSNPRRLRRLDSNPPPIENFWLRNWLNHSHITCISL